MNKVMLIGRITKDIELRKTANANSVISFTLAVNRRLGGSQEQQADFINCVAWNRTADLMNQYLHKGSMIAVEGRIQTRNYELEGQRVYVTEVVADNVQFLEPKSVAANRGEYNAPSVDYNEASFENNQEFEEDSFSMEAFDPSSEDLPF